jgi:hypothetical protein
MSTRIAKIHEDTVAYVSATNPSKRCTVLATRFRDAEMTSRKSSGSIRAESAVEPTRSENRHHFVEAASPSDPQHAREISSTQFHKRSGLISPGFCERNNAFGNSFIGKIAVLQLHTIKSPHFLTSRRVGGAGPPRLQTLFRMSILANDLFGLLNGRESLHAIFSASAQHNRKRRNH